VIFVTHDLDEAIRVGDRIILMKEGRLVQEDSPEKLLAEPANDFVRDFVGNDRALKRLACFRTVDHMRKNGGDGGVEHALLEDSTVRDALSRILGLGLTSLPVVDGEGGKLGTIYLSDIEKLNRSAAEEGKP
jgi:osmoprotectant transport system ATP-binding protein